MPGLWQGATGTLGQTVLRCALQELVPYRKAIEEEPRFYNRVDNQLKRNRKILKNYNKAGKATVRAKTVLDEGFDPNFFTHFWKNSKGDVYLFVYEFGFLKRTEHGTDKYVLVKWQEYMSPK